MKRLFNWLVKQEKILAVVTLVLVIGLVLQIRFCGSNIGPEVTASSNQTELKSPGTNVATTPDGLTGVWVMTVPNKKGVQTWTRTLTQNGDELSGVITSEGGIYRSAEQLKVMRSS